MNCPGCGDKGAVIDSRPRGDGTEMRRRYLCVCGERWTSLEFIVGSGQKDESGHIKDRAINTYLARKYSSLESELVADELIALAQRLLHGGGEGE